jgi:hypothetical protein
MEDRDFEGLYDFLDEAVSVLPLKEEQQEANIPSLEIEQDDINEAPPEVEKPEEYIEFYTTYKKKNRRRHL